MIGSHTNPLRWEPQLQLKQATKLKTKAFKLRDKYRYQLMKLFFTTIIDLINTNVEDKTLKNKGYIPKLMNYLTI